MTTDLSTDKLPWGFESDADLDLEPMTAKDLPHGHLKLSTFLESLSRLQIEDPEMAFLVLHSAHLLYEKIRKDDDYLKRLKLDGLTHEQLYTGCLDTAFI